MNINDRVKDFQRINLNEYLYRSRQRIDTWNKLKNAIDLAKDDSEKSRLNPELQNKIRSQLEHIISLETYWAFPGQEVIKKLFRALDGQNWTYLARLSTAIARLISTDHYRSHDWMTAWSKTFLNSNNETELDELENQPLRYNSNAYFEVLVVDSLAVETRHQLINHHMEHRRPEDNFVYNITVASSFEDAVIAILLNHNIQSCVIRYSFPYHTQNKLDAIEYYIDNFSGHNTTDIAKMSGLERSGVLADVLRGIRPELDLYLLSEATVEQVTQHLHRNFRRCFFGSEDYPETRLTILKGIQQRYESPFFHALKNYTQQPTGVFHAMPISRSKSITKSHWIQDYGEFYGDRIFLAETSSTTGGLDSLLQPSGSIRKAQDLAAKAFGSQQCLFVTNGTSTANKIVMQAIGRPGDIVLIPSDSHKSHHYAAMLADVCPVILPSYSLNKYTICGAVSSSTIQSQLLELKKQGQLHRVRALVLTNLSFDGIAYNLSRLMTECLAIKPDLIFLIDEAWFGYGMFSPITRQRCAMHVARCLKDHFSSKEYQEEYETWKRSIQSPERINSTENGEITLLPDPKEVKIRVYSTQSTHKTLTALRQASMIHVYDDDFLREISIPMREAFLCHTSTSPNYQILASLDIARRQMHFEGYELVQKAYELAMIVRRNIHENKLLSKYFKVLNQADLIPLEHQSDEQKKTQDSAENWQEIERAWSHDQFALDPSRITLDITRTGLDGREFQGILMDKYDIQVNKTSFNTVLIIIHIGSTRGMITYLIESLCAIARELNNSLSQASPEITKKHQQKIGKRGLTPATIPSFTSFHPCFRSPSSSSTKAGNLRKAYTLARKEGTLDYLVPTDEVIKEIALGSIYVSAGMVTPYPPGYPLLLPGQVISADIMRYLNLVKEQEVHGYDKDLGLQVFTAEAIRSLQHQQNHSKTDQSL